MATVACDVKDLELADLGKRRTEWAFQSMPVLRTIRKDFIKDQPLKGIRIAACLHVTTETANLMITLRDGGADVVLCASNPAVHPGRCGLHARQGLRHSHLRHQGRGQRLLLRAHQGGDGSSARRSPWTTAATSSRPFTQKRPELIEGVLGGTEETTTGVIRLKAMAAEGVLKYPVIAINDADDQAPLR